MELPPRTPQAQERVERHLGELKTKEYDVQAERIRTGVYLRNNVTLRKNRKYIQDKQDHFRKKLEKGNSTRKKADARKRFNLDIVQRLMDADRLAATTLAAAGAGVPVVEPVAEVADAEVAVPVANAVPVVAEQVANAVPVAEVAIPAPIVPKPAEKLAQPNPRRMAKDLILAAEPSYFIREWEKDTPNGAFRDAILEAMVHREIRPQNWIETRDREGGVYPNVEDPDFASRLYRKTEFAELSSKAVGDDTCSKVKEDFDPTAIQRLGARFLHPTTPYRGLLVDHGVGVGKTCSAITVAETFLDIMPTNTVYIIAPQSIAEGFRRTIFDANKLIPATKEHTALTGDVWKSPQCTGMTYLRLTGHGGTKSRDDIIKDVEKKIRKRYKIMGYLAFANWVDSFFAAIPEVIQGAAREDKKREIVLKLFSDHLIIIDEAHNLRDVESDAVVKDDEADATKHQDAAEGKRLTPILKYIVGIAEGLRLMLMTATPMYNSAPEIVFLLNILSLNDTKNPSDWMAVRDIFNKDSSFTAGGEAKLIKRIKRYVSYMRGENPNTFPLRLTPPEHGGEAFMAAYPTTSISRREGTVVLTETDKKIMSELPFIVHNVDETTLLCRSLTKVLRTYANPDEEGDITDFVLDRTMQMGNITYPDESYGTAGWSTYMSGAEVNVRGTKILQYSWKSVPSVDGVAPTLESVFGTEGLKQHAPKIGSIVESITKAVGISFVYSRYVMAGALPLAVALELAGWCRVLADGTPAPILNLPNKRYKHYYILLTANNLISPNFQGLIEYATTFENAKMAAGSRVKAIIGSQVASEGLDLKCIRELHLLDGWYHLNRIEQIEGRGVRFCSHEALPLAQRNCLIYLHVTNVPTYETGDLYAYRLAVRKAQPIGRVTRLMKIHAMDCMLNMDAILLKDLPKRSIIDAQGRAYDENLQDKPYSSFCDFMEQCEYACGSKPVPKENIGKNTSTYSTFDFRRKFLERQKILVGLFYDEDVAFPISFIRDRVYKDIPWSIAAIGLREILGTVKIRRDDGIIGTLIYLNGYIVFQPDGVTDTHIPLALRFGRAFGKLPRTITPERGSILQSAVPLLKAAEEPEIPAADTAAVHDNAYRALLEWRALVERMLTEPTGRIVYPEGFDRELFDLYRTIFYILRSVDNIRPILYRWFMDNYWTPKTRAHFLHAWTKAAIPEDAVVFADSYRPVELFRGDIRGFIVWDSELQTSCFADGDTEATRCSDLYKPYVEAAIGPAVNRKSDTDMGIVNGFLTMKGTNVIFKSVDMEEGKLSGAMCANTSNLSSHRKVIAKIQRAARGFLPAEDVLITALLDDATDTAPTATHSKAVKDAYAKRYDGTASAIVMKHIDELNRHQACMYMELLLRILDNRRVGGKRWFLSVVDSVRAGVKPQ